MSTVTLAASDRQALTLRRPQPLLAVIAWEIRRFRASRLFLWQALGFLCLTLFLIWARMTPTQFDVGNGGGPGGSGFTFHGFVAGTSAWGLLLTLPTSALLLLGVLLPFMNADGVTRDLQRRTHELLMTTALPNRAYVWGRYLTGLLMSLGLAVLSLIALLGMGWLLHLTVADYPAPEIGNLLTLWGSMVVPATVLVSSLSFALGTVLLRQSTLAKVVIMLGWFVGAVILPSSYQQAKPPAWYVDWDPTSAVTSIGTAAQYALFHPNDPRQHTITSSAQLQQILLTIENKAPDISSWLAPHLMLAGLSILLALAAAFTFRRFRNAFGA